MSDLTKSTTVARINNVDIVVIENGEKRVAVKPICEALGVDFSAQLQRLKTDPILSSTVGIIPTVGGDGKDREMVTIPFKFVFGWLFLIDSRKVNEDARETVMRYQLECYNSLYKHFIELDEYLKFRNDMAEQKFLEVEKYRDDFKNAKTNLDKAKEEFAEIRALTFEKYRALNNQIAMSFPDQT